jgi:hypothetical protein
MSPFSGSQSPTTIGLSPAWCLGLAAEEAERRRC